MSEESQNIIDDLSDFKKELKECYSLQYLATNEKATSKQSKDMAVLKAKLLEKSGGFRNLIKELSNTEKFTVKVDGKVQYSYDIWFTGLGIQTKKDTLKALQHCIDATTVAIGVLKTDINAGTRDNKGKLIKIPIKKNEEPITILEKIFRHFPLVVKRLSERYDNRAKFVIDDEYDVQDLLYAILTACFGDIRVEEPTPSYAGGSSRMDFLLKDEQVGVETKKTRKTLLDKQIGAELIIDIVRYKSYANCKTLICLIYDPDHNIVNPVGLVNDLNNLSTDELAVKVFISPT